jgi:hypothetical protein
METLSIVEDGSEARTWQETGTIRFTNDFVACDLGWTLIEDLRAYPTDILLARYRTPCLLFQGKRDDSVPWRGVVDLHFFADGDHRLTDRKERLWELMMEFLEGRRLI